MTAGPAATIKKVCRCRSCGRGAWGGFSRLRREIKAAIEEEVMKSMKQVSDADSSGG
jgi:hypothetical protein